MKSSRETKANRAVRILFALSGIGSGMAVAAAGHGADRAYLIFGVLGLLMGLGMAYPVTVVISFLSEIRDAVVDREEKRAG